MAEIIVSKAGGKYKIERDPYCFVLTKYRRTSETWETVGYYKEITVLVKKLVELSIMDHADLKKIVDVINTTCSTLSKQIERALK
jgi:hypothetical protein